MALSRLAVAQAQDGVTFDINAVHSLIGDAGAASDGNIDYSQSTLADYLGVSRLSIGKALKEFENAGFVETGYRQCPKCQGAAR